ncbi:MAG: CotH kinase family protein, partial [Flavicella sp.]
MSFSNHFFKHCVVSSLFVFYNQFITAQNYHWETVVLPGVNWFYTQPTSQPSSSWNTSNFDVSQWNSGPSGFGYGDADDATQTDPNLISVYMRLDFEIQNTAAIHEIFFDMDYDDGFVAYLNGQEIARSLLSGEPVAFDQTSDGIHEASLYRGGVPERFIVTPSILRNGTNVLAVQVHNESLGSSDLTALPVLSVKMEGDGFVYNEPPFWFQAPNNQPVNFESSNLPIVFLTTEEGQQIPDEPKINATMQIVERPDGERNLVEDKQVEDFLDYDGPIKIEVRGSSSTFFSKQQYSLTTYNNDDEKKNVKLLGMAKENDWILSGIAFDTTFVRDYVSYKLSNNVGQYASKGRYCEVVLND